MRMETPDTSATALPSARYSIHSGRSVRDYEPGRLARAEPVSFFERLAWSDYWQQRATTTSRPLSTPVLTKSPAPSRSGTRIISDTLATSVGSGRSEPLSQRQQRLRLFPADSRWGRQGVRGWIQLHRRTRERHVGAPQDQRHHDASRSSLASGPAWGKVTISIRYSFKVPEHGSDRIGRDSALYEIAQWYPRWPCTMMSVAGHRPISGAGEFYLEFADYEYSVTAPADM